MCRYCNTITMDNVSEGQASICVECVWVSIKLNGRPNLKPYWLQNGKFLFETGKVVETGRNSYISQIFLWFK